MPGKKPHFALVSPSSSQNFVSRAPKTQHPLCILQQRRVRFGQVGGGKLLGMQRRRTFLGGTIAVKSLVGIDMWCGRVSFSPFIERRNCARLLSANARDEVTRAAAARVVGRPHLHRVVPAA